MLSWSPFRNALNFPFTQMRATRERLWCVVPDLAALVEDDVCEGCWIGAADIELLHILARKGGDERLCHILEDGLGQPGHEDVVCAGEIHQVVGVAGAALVGPLKELDAHPDAAVFL